MMTECAFKLYNKYTAMNEIAIKRTGNWNLYIKISCPLLASTHTHELNRKIHHNCNFVYRGIAHSHHRRDAQVHTHTHIFFCTHSHQPPRSARNAHTGDTKDIICHKTVLNVELKLTLAQSNKRRVDFDAKTINEANCWGRKYN